MKFCGIVGYTEAVEETGEREGIWSPDKVHERRYYGDVLRNYRRWDSSNETIHDDLVMNNQISIMADDFAYKHAYAMKYVKWLGACWKVTNVEIQRPRMILTIGGVYNGKTN